MARLDTVWQDRTLTRTFLDGVRGGLPMAAEQIGVVVRLLAASDRRPRRVLDLGCGDGILGAAVRDAFPGTELVLLDFSAPMLDAARQRFAGQEPQPRFVRADFGDPGWVTAVAADAPLDAIVSAYAIHHQPDARKRALYAEIIELLAPGGWFINVEHVASPTPWLARVFEDLLVDGIADYHRGAGTGKTREEVADEFVHRPDKAANILAPVEEQCAWLRALGFADVDCYFKLFEFAVFGGRRLGIELAERPQAAAVAD